MRRTMTGDNRRRGIATLELVMVFPFLLAVAAALLMIARGDMIKTFSATQARQKAWQQRPQASPGQVLSLKDTPLNSEVQYSAKQAVPMGPLFKGQSAQAESQSHVTAQTWDYQSVPFQPGQKHLMPHKDVLAKILAGLLGGSTSTPTQPTPQPQQPSQPSSNPQTNSPSKPGFWNTKPGFWEGLIPIWGNGKNAIYYFKQGQWVWGIAYTGLAITDVFLVKSLVVGGIKIVVEKAAGPLLSKLAEWISLKGLFKILPELGGLGSDLIGLISNSAEGLWAFIKAGGWKSIFQLKNWQAWIKIPARLLLLGKSLVDLIKSWFGGSAGSSAAPVVSTSLDVFANTLSPVLNPVLRAAALVGTAANVLIQADGYILKYVISPVVAAAQKVVQALAIAARLAWQFSLADRLDKISNLMGLGLNAFSNLYEASQGRPGTWDPGLYRKLMGAF